MIRAFAKLTAQEIFDKVAKHLLTQNKRSLGAHETCQYRLGNLKCAAGILIEEEEYFSKIETYSWKKLVDLELASNHCQDLIKDLQGVHDYCRVKNWEDRLKEVAQKHGLKWSNL